MIERIKAGGGVGDLVVIGDVRQTALGAWEATLSIELHAERDTRVLRGDTCEAVARRVSARRGSRVRAGHVPPAAVDHREVVRESEPSGRGPPACVKVAFSGPVG
ncbi:MAG: hypothetical protein KDK70_17755 [Myxococcales bacterium]|nr:hypothetical protein [Myxococcales bacterium]